MIENGAFFCEYGTMRLVNVIPLAGGTKETLSYFTAKDIAPGALVRVPVRKKSVYALVVSSEDASLAKTGLKSSEYALRKVESVIAPSFFLPEFIEAARQTAQHFATTTGAVLEALTPARLLENSVSSLKLHADSKISHAPSRNPGGARQGSESGPAQHGHSSDILIFQASDEERFAAYKSIVREEFAKNASVFFCLSTIADIEKTASALERGIHEYTYILHAEFSPKELREKWAAILHETHPVLIIATGIFLSIPRRDVQTFVVEEESNYAYKLPYRPFIDIRTFAEHYARISGAKLILGDTFLRVETLYRHENHRISELMPPKFRALSNAKQKLINMSDIKDAAGKRLFRIIADELAEEISSSSESSEHFFLLTARRGLYPLAVCDDCSSAVCCRRCDAPMVLHTTPGYAQTIETDTMFVCHHCSEARSADDRCKTCGGWRFSLLGIGSEHVEERVREHIVASSGPAGDIPVFRLDKDSAPTRRAAISIRDDFYAAPRAIMIGTGMALGYLDKKIDHTAVISVDSLFTIPDFHINERMFNMLLRTRDLALASFTIQSRMAKHRIFESVMRGNMLDFYRSELAERKQFSYPPYTLLVKISHANTEQGALEAMARMKSYFADYRPMIFPAFTAKIKGRHVMNIVLKIDPETWPDQTLLAKLSGLPPSYAIAVDPDTIL